MGDAGVTRWLRTARLVAVVGVVAVTAGACGSSAHGGADQARAVTSTTAPSSTTTSASSTSTTTRSAASTAPTTSAASSLDGTYDVQSTGTPGCGTGFLDEGVTVTIHGATATLTPHQGSPYTGTVKATPTIVITVRIPAAPDNVITLTGSASNGTITGTSEDDGVFPSRQTGWACRNTFVATRTAAGGATGPSPTTAPPGDIAGLPAGLKCKDLASRGRSYDDAYAYWELHGHPPLMDADHNGIPCETVWPSSVVAGYLGAHGLTAPTPTTSAPGPSTASSGPCTVAAIQQALVAAGSTAKALGPPICDGPWAASAVQFLPTGDEGTSFWHWNGTAWVRGDCNAAGVPARIHLYGCEVS